MTCNLFRVAGFVLAASVVTIGSSACANSNTGAFSATTPSQTTTQGQASIQNDAGEYSGTVQDSALGSGNANASLAQDEQVVGGVLTVTFGSKSISNSFAAQTQTGTSLAGVEVASVNYTICSFSMIATYNQNTNVLQGTYKAVHGCSGETGSFSLTKACYYPRKGLVEIAPPGNGSSRVKPNHGVTQC